LIFLRYSLIRLIKMIDNQKSRILTFQVPAAFAADIDRCARARGVTRSEYVRAAIGSNISEELPADEIAAAPAEHKDQISLPFDPAIDQAIQLEDLG
jgi:hypothetical protein